MHELLQTLVNQFGKATTKLIPKENIQVMYHGMHWSFQQQDDTGFTTQTGELKKQQTTVHLEAQRIRDHDISLLPEFVQRTVEDMEKQLHQRLFSMIDEVTEKSGNVTAVPQGGSIAKAALDALEKVQLSLDSNGDVSLPSLYLNPASLERMSKEIAANPSAHAEATRQILEKKKEDAFAREQERLSRYDQ